MTKVVGQGFTSCVDHSIHIMPQTIICDPVQAPELQSALTPGLSGKWTPQNSLKI
eukprot:c6244_g1_i1 orf=79-243(+)